MDIRSTFLRIVLLVLVAPCVVGLLGIQPRTCKFVPQVLGGSRTAADIANETPVLIRKGTDSGAITFRSYLFFIFTTNQLSVY